MDELLSPAEACLKKIIGLFLGASRSGSEREVRRSYTEALRVLEAYVVSELKRRAVANANADSDIGHMRDAVDLLRSMVSNDPSDVERLSAWYIRDRERGAAHPKKYADDPENGGGS